MLSIVMMAKNEEKYIGKVFESLKEVRENISTEVILLDTGSTDNTINIAKSYDVKVYFEKWNDDFSYMRNKSISYAKNDWILILDADEVVVDSNKLIEFFKNGNHKKYNSGVINIKNITSINNNNKDISSSCNMLRFFRNTKNFKFYGIIHEQPIYQKPTYNEVLLICEHYGYMFDYLENLQLKNIRNLKLLKKQREIEENNPYVYFQIAKTYLCLSKYADADYNINICKDLYSDISKSYYIYITMIDIKYNLKEYISALNLCNEYIEFDEFNIDIFYRTGIISYKLKNYNECIKYLNRYIYLCDNYNITSQCKDILIPFDTKSSERDSKIIILKSYFNLENYDKVLDLFNTFNDIRNDVFYEFIVSNYKKNNLEYILNYYNNIKEKITRDIFIESLEECLHNIFTTESCNYIYRLFSRCVDKNYSELNNYRLNKIYTENINSILKESNEKYISEFLYIYITNEKNIFETLLNFEEDKIRTVLNNLLENYSETKLLLYNFLISRENTLNINLIKIYKIISDILFSLEGFEDDKYINIFNLNVMYNYIYFKLVYKNFLNDNNKRYILNSKELNILNIIDLLDDKLKLCKYLKDLVHSEKNYFKVIENYMSIIQKENNYTDEMIKIKNEFIDIIRNNLSFENINYIESLINQYDDIFNSDSFSLNLKGIISIYKNNFEGAEKNLKYAMSLDIKNCDIIYNIGYLKERKNDIEYINFYEFCKLSTDN